MMLDPELQSDETKAVPEEQTDGAEGEPEPAQA
jgi:hypothetical protein